jgi:tetratricopeptide (TPR) repeat protein
VNERNIFLAAVTRTSPADQAAYLNQACAGDAESRQRIEALLQAHEQLRTFFDRPAGELIVAPERPSDKEGSRFDWLGGGAVLATLLIVVVSLIAVAAAVWWVLRGRAVEEELLAERDRAEAAQLAALENRLQAEKQLQAVKSIELDSLVTELGANDPNGSTVSAKLLDRVDKATAQLDAEGAGDSLAAAASQHQLAKALMSRGEAARAINLLVKARATRVQDLGPDHPDAIATTADLARAYHNAGRIAEALPLYDEVLKRRIATFGPDHPVTEQTKENLAIAYIAASRWTDAESLLRDILSVREQKQPDDWATFHAKSLLGAALLGQKKYAEAEPLLVQGYEGMKQREMKTPPTPRFRLVEALERLVKLYEAWDKKDAAAKWKDTLDAERAGELPTK